jgi:cysteinyl-tRNA synthetase, unknown class
MRTWRNGMVAVATLMGLVGLSATGAVAQDRPNGLLNAKSWAFQLKNLGPEQQAKIAASPYDLVVIDSEQFPQDKEIPLTREEVERMKKKPDGGRRLVIAYFSIGEAENYRYYWKPEWNRVKPSWVGKENKQWGGNFLVQYWDPTWQNIIMGGPKSFADQVINSGFDGFYIDRADAYYYYGDTNEKRNQMADFVIKLANYIRSKKPDALILAQNAEELLDRPAYVKAIDGIAKEDLIYGISHTEKINPAGDISHSSGLLTSAKKAGKAIFVIEYLTKPALISDAVAKVRDLGFVPYVGPRGLAELYDGTTGAGPRRGPLDPTPEAPSLKKKADPKKKAAVKGKAAKSSG